MPAPARSLLFPWRLESSNFCCRQNFSRVSPGSLSGLLVAPAVEDVFFFFFWKESGIVRRRVGEAVWPPALRFSQKWGLVRFTMALFCCRRHRFTLVAHNWKFWQMYFAWKYCTEVVYVYMYSFWMYFLTLTPGTECNFFVFWLANPSLGRLSGEAGLLWSRRPPDSYCTVYCLIVRESI